MRRLAPLVLVLLTLSGCSSTTTPVTQGAAVPSGAASGGAKASAPAKGSAARPAATGKPVGANTASTAPARPGATPGASQAAKPYAGIPAGTYTYDAKGSFSYGGAEPREATSTATLQVTALKGGKQTTTLRNDQSETVRELLVRDSGTSLARLSIGAPISKDFVPSPAALLYPSPAKVGASWSWKATSTDGKSTISSSNKVTRVETLTVGGKRVETVVLQTRLVISGEVDYTADVTTWVASASRLPVKDHTVGKGTYSGFPFSTDVTTTLRSTVPA